MVDGLLQHDRNAGFQEPNLMMSAAGDGGPALGASRVGAELRAARHRLGWALPDVAATLEAIEDGRVADLPGNTYAVGFLRSYAAMLGLDPGELARRFRAEAHEVNRKTELAFPVPVPQRGVPAMAVVLLGMVVAAGAYVGWYRTSGDARTATEAVPAVPERLAPLADRAALPSNLSPQVASILPPPPSRGPAPVAAAPVAVAPAPLPVPAPVPAPVPVPVLVPAVPPAAARPAIMPGVPDATRVTLRVTSDAWVQVRGQGQVLLSRVMHGGETWPVPRGMQVTLTTGNAAGTELLVDGVPGPSLGAAGAVRRNVPVDGDATKPEAVIRTASQQSQ